MKVYKSFHAEKKTKNKKQEARTKWKFIKILNLWQK